jgi:hypothetical protein
MLDPAPFEISSAQGAQIATNGAATLTLQGEGRVFRRRAVKVLGDEQRRVEWAVAELEGVFVYFDGQHVVVSKQDLQP